jgi:A49-like RNA polymerase I associated factor
MLPKKLSVNVQPDKSDSLPILVAFPQGICEENHDDMQLIIGKKSDGSKKRKQHVVIADLGGMKYRGDDIGKNSTRNDFCKFAVGVVREGGKDMEVYRADHVYVMKPQFSSERVPERNASMTNTERRQTLTEEFGSRKKKRALKAAQSNIISSENIVGVDAVESTMATEVEDMDVNAALINAADQAMERNRQLLLPTYNAEATAVEDAYPIDDLVPKHLSSALKNRYETIRAELAAISGQDEDALVDVSLWRERFRKEQAMSIVDASLDQLSAASSSKHKKVEKKHKTAISRLLLLQYMLRFYLKVIAAFDQTVVMEDLWKDLEGMPSEVLDYIAGTFCIKKNARGKPSLLCNKANS